MSNQITIECRLKIADEKLLHWEKAHANHLIKKPFSPRLEVFKQMAFPVLTYSVLFSLLAVLIIKK